MSTIQESASKETILIVDDILENLQLLAKTLSEQGYVVRLAPDGQLALQFVQSNQPDLILLDVLMPEMDGYEICRELKISSKTQDIPVIFISALHEVFDKVKAFSLGGVDYITKPFEAKEVLARIDNQLRISRLSKQLVKQNAQLAEQKELLQTIFDHIPLMVVLFNASGQVQLVNRELERVSGWSHTELEHIDLIAECFPDPEYHQQVLEHISAATGKWQDFKVRIRNGKFLDTSWSNIQLLNGMNIGIGQDISERLAAELRDRKQAEEGSQLEERNRMAREIHDTLAQAFTGVLIHMGTVSRLVTTKPEAIQTHINIVRELARNGLIEARRSVAALRPQSLEDGNLWTALEQFVATMQSSTETRLICEITGTPYILPADTENNLLRIAQEAFTNAIRYAQADEIRVKLAYEPMSCCLRIKDNGQGFEANNTTLSRGFGLLGMTERAERIGAQLSIESQLGQGTEVIVSVEEAAT